MATLAVKTALVLGLVAVCLYAVSGQEATTAMPEEPDECNKYRNCSNCIQGEGNATVNLECYWCESQINVTRRCRTFSASTAIPINGIPCDSLKYNVGTCTLNALSIIIIIAVFCLLFVVMVTCFCCCCCVWCAKRKRKVQMIEETKYLEEKDSIRQRSAERRAERKAKHDDIRRKYGLNEPDGGTYKRLE